MVTSGSLTANKLIKYYNMNDRAMYYVSQNRVAYSTENLPYKIKIIKDKTSSLSSHLALSMTNLIHVNGCLSISL
jgi:hypothetical protein